MKYVKLRGNTYYYRRRVPLELQELANITVIHRPLSRDKYLAKQLANKYDNLFNMIDMCIKLNEDINKYVSELNLKIEHTDIFAEYIARLDVSEERSIKVGKLIDVVKEFLPNDLSRIDLSKIDRIREGIIGLPRRSLSQYRYLEVSKLIRMDIPTEHRLGLGATNEHITALNAFLKYIHQRELTSREFRINLVKNTTNSRDAKVALPTDTIQNMIADTKKAKVRSSFTLLFLTGMRPSEAYVCKVTTIDGIKSFDLRDKSQKLKTKGSYRLIPVHKDITDPEQLLEDYRSIDNRIVSRGFKKVSGVGTLYSLRHSFATELAAKGVEPHIISELLGHSHSGMTLSRYVKSFPIQILKDAVDTLFI